MGVLFYYKVALIGNEHFGDISSTDYTTNSNYRFPRGYLRVEPFVLKIRDAKIKIDFDELAISRPMVELVGFIYIDDFLFEEKIEEVFEQIKNRWEILDL